VSDDCQHEPLPLPPERGVIDTGDLLVDTNSLPPAGQSRYRTCRHCGGPLLARRDTRVRIDIWTWREWNGLDPYGSDFPEPAE
jgi:hypothetical protein